MELLIISITPVIAIAFYIYFRDKYEKEPIGLLLLALIVGALITIPILFIEKHLEIIFIGDIQYFIDNKKYIKTIYDSFFIASLTEEGLKFLAVILLIWWNKNFNEKFDGIVYAVFISLGFAAVENLLYVFKSGTEVGIVRAFTAVPFHALLGVVMGFYLGNAKFNHEKQRSCMLKAFMLPFLIHGVYDFCLLINKPVFLLLWIPFLVFIWKDSFSKMHSHSEDSIFKPE